VRALRFVDALREHAGYEQKILADIGPALARKELQMAFQPKWSIAQSRVCGFEALIRWTHPELGRIMPDQFITVLENAGRIDELTLYAIDACMAQLRDWHGQGHDLGVAVNISAGLLSDPHFAEESLRRVKDLGPLAPHLTFEITETVAFEETGAAADLLRSLRELGLRVSVDDYGTGQSTLSYLKAFPANEIKIDKGFVMRMVQSPSDQILVRSTIELAHELGFTVVAEGVEDTATLAQLTRYGCDVAQGWCIGRPLPVEEIDIGGINERMRRDLKMVA
jgi:EAL domain-containing protein (putative c-di-GMP-specific phosphodiesterase class I)